MNEKKKPWMTPVLHTRGVEETLSGPVPDTVETSDYHPTSGPDAS